MKFQECLKRGKYQASFKKVSWVFQLRLKRVLSSFKGVSRVFERSCVLGKFQRCFTKFQRSFQEVSRLLKGSFKGIS